MSVTVLAFARATRGGRAQIVTRIQVIRTAAEGLQVERKKKLAENGGLEVVLEPDGVSGIWNAGAFRLYNEDDPLMLW